ncbi:sensor domain-containing diguanylate cyclase [Parasphingorhabdus sp.]|uniref:sensor domain-containing diguanylate cyclase n=1 Tax=Parasphingorhabdus sp. TaxID=2709688 RepID=UPI0030033A11
MADATVSPVVSKNEMDSEMWGKDRFQFEAEAARQFALERYDILDTGEEFCFDHITRAASLALDVPIAAISLIDGKRQWFKSKIGIDISETARNITFCDHTIRQDAPMIIEDAAQSALFRDSPFVKGEPFISSYVGVPLTTPDGHRIGSLCGMDVVPRKFKQHNIALLGELSELVIHELELRQQADKDRLTGALTRSGFSVEARKAISLFDRQQIISTLILFDIDLYQMLDGPSRRSSGSGLLAAIIQSLMKRLRPSDCVGRMGGTQFAVLLTGSTKLQALAATEEILDSARQANTDVVLDLSFSEISREIGICDDWLRTADIALRETRELRHAQRWTRSRSPVPHLIQPH